jgi:hypothetical protein
MPDSYVELPDIPMMRVKADMMGKGPPAAFDRLESKLPTLKGRKFYGVFQQAAGGEPVFHACVAQVESDDPKAMGLETWVLPGGRYVSRKVMDWEKVVREGKLPGMFDAMAQEHMQELLHRDLFSVEYYRSMREMHMLLPVKPLERTR